MDQGPGNRQDGHPICIHPKFLLESVSGALRANFTGDRRWPRSWHCPSSCQHEAGSALAGTQVEGQGILPIQPRMLGQGALRDVPPCLGQDRSKAQRSSQATSCTAVSTLVAKALCPYTCSVLSQGNRSVGGAHPPGGRKCPSSPGH